MITLSEIEEEIATHIKDAEAPRQSEVESSKWEKQRKKAAKRVVELTHLKRFLQDNPKKEDLEIHLETLTKQRNFINDPLNYDKWLTCNPAAKNDMKKAKTQYQKEFNLSHINSQIKTLKYLLQ